MSFRNSTEWGNPKNREASHNMNQIVGTCNILFLCLDALRYDVALEEQENKRTPVLNSFGNWSKRHAPGNFTLPSHIAMFAGFLPTKAEPQKPLERERLFCAKHVGESSLGRQNAFVFDEQTFVQGLHAVGYTTICIGGLSFFDKRSKLGNLLPSFFEQSYWRPTFACTEVKSTENQVNFAIEKLKINENKPVFLYINISAIHFPNNHYINGKNKDDLESHAAALQYVDAELSKLFEFYKTLNRNTFTIVCSDHGTCYGDDGYYSHGLSHEAVNTVPYMDFIIQGKTTIKK